MTSDARSGAIRSGRGPVPGQGGGGFEQLGFEGMPERLFVCTPSKLASFEDCPRRYRYSYVDRPAPQKGPPWAHNSLGASVHTALRSWYGLPAEKRVPEAVAGAAAATWVGEGYRDDEQERAAFRTAARLAGGLRRDAGSARRAGRSRARRGREDRRAGVVRPGRPDRSPRRRAGHRRLQDRPQRADRRRRARFECAGAVCVRGRSGVPPSVSPSRAAPLADRHGRGARAHRRVARAGGVPRRGDCPRHSVRRGGAGRRRQTRTRRFPTAPGALCSYCDFRRSCPDGAEAPVKQRWSAIESHLAD